MSSFEEYCLKNIGMQIRKYRKQYGYKQEELSQKFDLNEKYIGHVERCERDISLKSLIKIMAFFNIQPREFFNFENEFIWKK